MRLGQAHKLPRMIDTGIDGHRIFGVIRLAAGDTVRVEALAARAFEARRPIFFWFQAKKRLRDNSSERRLAGAWRPGYEDSLANFMRSDVRDDARRNTDHIENDTRSPTYRQRIYSFNEPSCFRSAGTDGCRCGRTGLGFACPALGHRLLVS